MCFFFLFNDCYYSTFCLVCKSGVPKDYASMVKGIVMATVAPWPMQDVNAESLKSKTTKNEYLLFWKYIECEFDESCILCSSFFSKRKKIEISSHPKFWSYRNLLWISHSEKIPNVKYDNFGIKIDNFCKNCRLDLYKIFN